MPASFQHRLEYSALRAAAGVLKALPRRAARRAALSLSAGLRPLARRRLAEAERRVRQVLGPDPAPERIRRVARAAFRNVCLNAVEMVRNEGCDADWVRGHVHHGELDRLRAHLATGRGAIAALPHSGNWDLGGVVAFAAGLPLFSIARRQSNPLTDAWMNRLRSASGMETLPNDRGLLRGVIRRLQAGRLLAMLPDVRVVEGGVKVRLFGGEAWLGGGMALFARAAKVPVFPVFVSREGLDRHRIRVFDPVWPDPAASREADAVRLTQAVIDPLQAEILSRPDQYFWFNKRWVLDPPATGGARPFGT